MFTNCFIFCDRFISSVELTKVMSDLGERLSEEEVITGHVIMMLVMMTMMMMMMTMMMMKMMMMMMTIMTMMMTSPL